MCKNKTKLTNRNIMRDATKFLWVIMTPLGIPVVPLEYGNRTRSSSTLKIVSNGNSAKDKNNT